VNWFQQEASRRQQGSAIILAMRFQIYILDELGNAIQFIELYCANVDAAKERAAQLVDEHAVELWDGPKHIARFGPSDAD
jgi:hypothetical protein